MVLIHDAVRPFVDAALIDRTIDAIDERQGALPAMQVADTLKRMNGEGNVGETVPRAGLHAAQTPQGFPFWPILAAHEKAFQLGKHDFTDDAAVAEWAKIPVRIVTGSPDNMKLTWASAIWSWPTSGLAADRPFPMSAPATAMTCIPSSRATTSRSAA